ncbi:MAG: rRNA maturation RNase YbeY [Lachnospiraceae bacterium]|nr:rRNA maturation RNase YbeY [Lachnospiraceae bacterium]
MTFYVENEVNATFPFDVEETVNLVLSSGLSFEKVPYDATVNILITDKEGIREYNRTYRDIDKETDVLSFPAVDYDSPCDFSYVKKDPNAYMDMDTNELILGDMILCAERVKEQALEYGHSELREFSFLLTHSLLHLLGYDHMEKEEERIMFAHQEDILKELNITR